MLLISKVSKTRKADAFECMLDHVNKIQFSDMLFIILKLIYYDINCEVV